MTLTPSLPTGAPAGLPLLAERRIWAGAVARAADGTPRTGILPAHVDPLVTGKASMGYNIAEFVAVTSRELPGVEFVANDGMRDLSPAGYAAPNANSRIDVIWVRCRFVRFGDAADGPEFGITQGAASPTPVKPSLPSGALELAVAEVKATDTTTQTVVITQTHRYTAMAGGKVMLRTDDDLDKWSPPDGSEAYVLSERRTRIRANGSWAPLVATAVFDFTIGQFTDATLADAAITAVQNDGLTTDTSFILSRSGTKVNVRRGVYAVSIQFASSALPLQPFIGRTFAEISVEGGTGVRFSAPPNTGENAVGGSLTAVVLNDGGAITGSIYKRTGATSPVSGRLVVTKLS